MYYVTGMHPDGRVTDEFEVEGPEAKAIERAKRLLTALTFEGSSVRVMSIDGELVWEKTNGSRPVRAQRKRVSKKKRGKTRRR